MNTPLAREIYIRLTDNQQGFVCTVKYGRLYSTVTEFRLHSQPQLDRLEETTAVKVRKRSSDRTPEHR
jgi:hypothetical protein